MSETLFKNKTVFISGAGSGIGAATALHFAQLGATLILTGRRLENLQLTAQKIKAFGTTTHIHCLDMNNTHEVRTLFQNLPTLDIAVNNAGIEGSLGETQDLTEDDFDAVLNTNVKSLWVSMQEQVRWWRSRNQKGCIINISSIAGIRAFPESSLYVASKHAVIGLSQATALEQIPHGIRINVVSPGAVNTDMLHRIFPTHMAAVAAKQPIGRIGQPSEIAEAIVWLASEQSSFVVGHNLVIDGGKTILG